MKHPTAPEMAESLYPVLPSDGPADNDNTPRDQYFRLQEISQLRKHLEDERNKRTQLYKKYQRGVNAVDAVDTTLISASMGMGIGGVRLLSTIVAAPVVLGLEVAALGCGLLGVAGKFIGRRLLVKAKKHDEVRVLAESKLNTIADHVSKALADGMISEGEFHLIAEEAHKYTQMKAEVRAGAKKAYAAITIDKETKNSLIQRGRDEARASFMKKLAVPWIVPVFVSGVCLSGPVTQKPMTHLRGAPSRPFVGKKKKKNCWLWEQSIAWQQSYSITLRDHSLWGYDLRWGGRMESLLGYSRSAFWHPQGSRPGMRPY